MNHTILPPLVTALLLAGCAQQEDQLNDRGTRQPNTCINGVAYFSMYKGYSLYIDETTLQPVRCSELNLH